MLYQIEICGNINKPVLVTVAEPQVLLLKKHVRCLSLLGWGSRQLLAQEI